MAGLDAGDSAIVDTGAPSPDADMLDGAMADAGRWWEGLPPDYTCPDGDCAPRCNGSQCVVDCVGASNCKPECRGQARCRIDCTDASNCEVGCGGASCDIRCSASNCRMDCQGNSGCELDCRGADNCEELRCHGGSTCLVYCGDSSCALDCDGGETSCPGGTLVCNRACP